MVQGSLGLGGALVSAAGLETLERIEGDLVIGPSYQLDDTAALSRLRVVAGSVRITRNAVLSGVFLPNLVDIGGSLAVSFNPNLRRLSLPKWSSGGKGRHLEANPSLEGDLEGQGPPP